MTSRSDPQPSDEPPEVYVSEQHTFLRSLADELNEMLAVTERAMAAKFDGQLFDLDEGNDLWALLPAKARTAIKRGREKPVGLCPECGGLGTHTRNCVVGGRFVEARF